MRRFGRINIEFEDKNDKKCVKGFKESVNQMLEYLKFYLFCHTRVTRIESDILELQNKT